MVDDIGLKGYVPRLDSIIVQIRINLWASLRVEFRDGWKSNLS